VIKDALLVLVYGRAPFGGGLKDHTAVVSKVTRT